ncbi:MAG TPA: hypothetical protein VIN59_08790 [Alphaproteobacteria bacterium]
MKVVGSSITGNVVSKDHLQKLIGMSYEDLLPERMHLVDLQSERSDAQDDIKEGVKAGVGGLVSTGLAVTAASIFGAPVAMAGALAFGSMAVLTSAYMIAKGAHHLDQSNHEIKAAEADIRHKRGLDF